MKRRAAFTLVELLVVIGIIALLISILLPALSKARQSANKAACLSNLHTMAIAVNMYLGQSKGILPYSRGGFDSANNELTWGSLLSSQMGMGTGTANSAGDYNSNRGRGVFLCKDAATLTGAIAPKNHYSVHPLLMPNILLAYPSDAPIAYGNMVGQFRRPYRVTKLANSAQIVLIWDGVLTLVDEGTTGPTPVLAGNSSPDGFALDKQRITNNTDAPKTYLLSTYCQRTGVDMSQSVDAGTNQDTFTGSVTDRVLGNIRWRHSNNTAANFLFVDGHAGTFSYKKAKGTAPATTDLLRRNVNVPAPH